MRRSVHEMRMFLTLRSYLWQMMLYCDKLRTSNDTLRVRAKKLTAFACREQSRAVSGRGPPADSLI